MRRLAAAVGIVLVLALALTLLWCVYVHHSRAEPFEHEDRAVVALPSRAA
ncbi:MAG: hypothetical protein JO315_19930 [Acidobacteria bacterium]|nr:hypothetical protein [Acidobacteriota bacterium]